MTHIFNFTNIPFFPGAPYNIPEKFRKILLLLQSFEVAPESERQMKIIRHILLAAVTAVSAASCSDTLKLDFSEQRQFWNGSQGTATRNPAPDSRRTLIVYSAGYNNLSSALRDDIDDISENYLPEGYGYCDNLLVLAHHSVSDYDYRTDNPPCLIRLYRNRDGKAVRDTIKTWPEDTRAVDPSTLTDVLSYVKKNFPSKEYGMIFSSHSTGWLPPQFSMRSIGQDGGTGAEMDVKDFAAAIPFRLSYIIFDACLTGGVEVAYELKDKCEYLVFSSEEILADGMVYTNITSRLLEENPSNLIGVAEDYFGHYDSLSGQYRSALISVVDCSMLDHLADISSGIFGDHAGQLGGIDPSKVQKLNYQTRYFYDFRDILSRIADESEMAEIDTALEDCILYKAHTPYFFSNKVDRFCGLSMYLPTAVSSSYYRDYLNDYYKDFKWNQATNWISDLPIY